MLVPLVLLVSLIRGQCKLILRLFNALNYYILSLRNVNDLNKRNNSKNLLNTNNQNLLNQPSSNNNTSTKDKTASNASFFNNNYGLTIINECSFIKNNANGLKIFNYSEIVYITNCVFSENFENGIHLENDLLKINNSISEEYENQQNKNVKNYFDKNLKVSENKNNTNFNNELDKNSIIKKKIERFKIQDFTNINNWLENIIKKIKSMFTNENASHVLCTNFVNFNLETFLKENIIVNEKLNYDTSLNVSNLQNIFYNIFQTINQNGHLIPKDFRDFNIPYIGLSFSKIESNSKSGINLTNSFLLIEGNTILDNGEFSILISKEEYKEFYKENKSKKNTIDADIGGPWGKAKSGGFSCNCFNSHKNKSSNRTKDKNENNPDNNKSKNIHKDKKGCLIF